MKNLREVDTCEKCKHYHCRLGYSSCKADGTMPKCQGTHLEAIKAHQMDYFKWEDAHPITSTSICDLFERKDS